MPKNLLPNIFLQIDLIWIKNACVIKEDNQNQHFFIQNFVLFLSLKLYYMICYNHRDNSKMLKTQTGL